jgi:hypothetical protein
MRFKSLLGYKTHQLICQIRVWYDKQIIVQNFAVLLVTVINLRTVFKQHHF